MGCGASAKRKPPGAQPQSPFAKKVSAKPKAPGAQPQSPGAKKVASGDGPASGQASSQPARGGSCWQPSLLFGADAVGMKAGAKVTATETMHLVAHKGKLFASFGKWMSPEFQAKDFKNMNNFIGRLDSADGAWVVDMQSQGTSNFAARFACLKSIAWTRDLHGKDLSAPVGQLVMCYGLGEHGNRMMFRRDDDDNAPGTQYRWEEANFTGKHVDKSGGSDKARAVVLHRDSVTGIDRIFVLQGNSGAVSGVFDPSSKSPGKVVWDQAPESLQLAGGAKTLPFRPLAMVEANGKLYMSSAGWILQRVDGPKPVWKVVVDVTSFRTDGKLHEAVGGIRGLTAVPTPGRPGSSILFCWNPNSESRSWILRIDPAEDGESMKPPVEETAITKLAQQYLGVKELSYTLAAYNDMLETRLGPSACNLIGFQVCAYGAGMARVTMDPHQTKPKHGFWAGGGFAIRKGPGEYEVMEVGGPRASPKQVKPVLTAVRCYANSPFPEEPGVVYFGGYDCNSFPSQHTAWIYKGKLEVPFAARAWC